jgi:hypothetical protein
MYEKSDEDRSDTTSSVSQTEPKTATEDVEPLESPKNDAEPALKNALQGGKAYIAALQSPLPPSTEDVVAGGQEKTAGESKVEIAKATEEEQDLTPNGRTAPLA